jgi:cell division septum initiation protein DivIVA
MEDQTQILQDAMQADTFETAMRGYHKRQVDEFVVRSRQHTRELEERLSITVDRLAQARREAAEVAERAAKAPHEEVSERMAKILQLAAEEADQARARAADEIAARQQQAQEEAQGIVDGAQGQADGVLAAAREEAEALVGAAREQASAEMALAQQQAEGRLTSSREEAERTLSSAQEEAERLLGDAQRRTAQINDVLTRRLQTLTATHSEAVRRLTEIRDVVADLVDSDTAAGVFDAPEPLTIEEIEASAPAPEVGEPAPEDAPGAGGSQPLIYDELGGPATASQERVIDLTALESESHEGGEDVQTVQQVLASQEGAAADEPTPTAPGGDETQDRSTASR